MALHPFYFPAVLGVQDAYGFPDTIQRRGMRGYDKSIARFDGYQRFEDGSTCWICTRNKSGHDADGNCHLKNFFLAVFPYDADGLFISSSPPRSVDLDKPGGRMSV